MSNIALEQVFEGWEEEKINFKEGKPTSNTKEQLL